MSSINRSYARHMARLRMEEAKVKPKKVFRSGKGKWRAWVHGPERRSK